MKRNKKFDKDIGGSNFAVLFSYLESIGKDTALISESTGLHKELLINRREYFDLETGIKIFDSVKKILDEKDPMIFFDIGRESSKLRTLGVIEDIGLHLGNPRDAVKFIPRFNRKFNDIFNMLVFEVTDNSATIIIEYKKEYNGFWIYDQCAWNRGIIASIPVPFNLPFMEINESLCRYSLDEIFRDYSYIGHNYRCECGKAYINGNEFAAAVSLGTEELLESHDILKNLNPFFSSNKKTVFTNKNYRILTGAVSKNMEYNLSEFLITKETRVSDKLILREGQIFGAPYCRLDVKWQNKDNRIKKLLDIIKIRSGSEKLLNHLEKELEINIEQKQNLIKSQDELKEAHRKLKEYSENLEIMVRQRTIELEKEKEKVLNAQNILSRYVAPQLAKKILDGQIETVHNHKRQKLSLFFSDVVDFTQVTDVLEPEDMAHILNEYFSEMFTIIDEYEGTLAQMIGDGLYVVFGAPDFTSDKDHALRCLKMAIMMQLKMRNLGIKWFNEGIEHPLKIRCGINTGIATIGTYGTEKRREYVAMGMQVNIASRLESSANPGEIFISHSTWGIVKDEIACEEVEPIKVKGLSRPIRAYRVLIDRYAEQTNPRDTPI